MVFRRQFATIVNSSVIVLVLLWSFWWIQSHPLPDGLQNEYLHIGNAYDLWNALTSGDLWHLRWYAYTSYWPFGFYLAPWPYLSIFGATREALVLSNLTYVLVLVSTLSVLSTRFKSPYAPALLFLSPAIFGSVVRFEPNIATVSMVSLCLLCLLNSKGFSSVRWSLVFGACLGVGLMLDRLILCASVLPPALWLLAKQRQWKNASYSFAVVTILTVAYYREFLIRHTDEIVTQITTGEIDSSGTAVFVDNPIPLLYYLLSLFDNISGPFVGVALVLGCIAAWRSKQTMDTLLWCSLLPQLVLFSLLSKQQSYYAIPALVPLVLLAGRDHRIALFGVAGGALTWLSVGCGVGTLGGPWITERYVAPRYELAEPPSDASWPLSEIGGALEQQCSIVIFSETPELYEGFLVLALRERLPTNCQARGVTMDPMGIWEFWEDVDSVLWVRNHDGAWPRAGQMRSELILDHYQLKELPPLAARIEEAKLEFKHHRSWTIDDTVISVHYRQEK